jgi:hypothetical protein
MRLGLVAVALSLIVLACDSKKEVASAETEPQTDTVVVIMEPAPPKDSLAITYEQTPCFGRCPVYKVKIYESGFATYEGLNFAEKMGLYAFTFEEATLKQIYQMAEEIDYFDMQAVYDDPRISDLPSTISSISIDGKSHRIKARRGMPSELKEFHKALDEMLMDVDWKPFSFR